MELSNLLTLATNESVFQDDSIKETFPSLNLAQIRKIIEFYIPDENLPDPIPVNVKRFISGKCKQDYSVNSMSIELEPVLPLSSLSGNNIEKPFGYSFEEEYDD